MSRLLKRRVHTLDTCTHRLNLPTREVSRGGSRGKHCQSVALDQQICRTDYRTLQYVKRPGSPMTTHKSFVVEAGNPGLKDA